MQDVEGQSAAPPPRRTKSSIDTELQEPERFFQLTAEYVQVMGVAGLRATCAHLHIALFFVFSHLHFNAYLSPECSAADRS